MAGDRGVNEDRMAVGDADRERENASPHPRSLSRRERDEKPLSLRERGWSEGARVDKEQH